MDWFLITRFAIVVIAQASPSPSPAPSPSPSSSPSPSPSPSPGSGGDGGGGLFDVAGFLGDLISRLFDLIKDVFNAIFKVLIDGLAVILPSTPESLKLSALVSGFLADDAVSSNFDYFLLQIFQGLAGILLLVIIYKVIKILPFT